MATTTQIPGYELLERITGAGDASLHRAKELNSGRLCALSVLSVDDPPLPEQEERQLRFLEQGKQLLDFRHPHVVRAWDVGSGRGASWIALELPPGVTLHTILERATGPLPVEAALAIGVQLGRALAGMAEAGLVHRDLSALSVLLAADGKVSLTGFGLNLESSYERLSAGQAPLGSVDFLSPEQVEGDLPPTSKTDVYALGAVLYRCLAGRVPHSGATLFTRLRAIAHDTPPDLRELNPAIDDAVARLIGGLMEWDADDRPLPADVAERVEATAAALGLAGPGWVTAAVAALVEQLGGPESSHAGGEGGLIVRLRGTDRTIERRLEVGEAFEVGRAADAAVSLRFGWISRRHARVELTPRGLVLTDLRSANGTTVNREKVRGSVTLASGDLVAFGKSRFEVAIRPGRAQVAEQQCALCGQELAGEEGGVDALCVRCQARAEVDRKAAESRIQLVLEEAHFEVDEPLPSPGLFKRFRVVRRKKAFLVSAIELGQRTAKVFAEQSNHALELKHPGLLATFDLQVRSGILIVVHEDHPGRTLQALVEEEGPLTAEEVTTIGQGLCDAVDFALQLGVVHTLVRPDLVLVDEESLPCLMDVGLAPGLVEAARSREGYRSRPCYEAPEVEDVGALTPRAAVYAIGATLSFALTGSPVAEVRSGERYEHLPLTMVSAIPRPLAELLAQATAHEAAERIPDPGTLRQALEDLLFEGPTASVERVVDEDEATRPPQTQRLSRERLEDD